MNEQLRLKPVDAADVTILVDNTMDILLPGNEWVHRAPIRPTTFEEAPLLAEHGYSLLLTLFHEGRSDSILYDAGLGKDTVVHNMDVLGIRMDDVRAVVLSHGHKDHHGGMPHVLRRIGKQGLPLVVHPDVWRDRKGVFGAGGELHLPPPDRSHLERAGAEIRESRAPSLLLEGRVLVTGQVERTTDFEKGVPTHLARHGEDWEPDPSVWDDQAVMVHVRDKGLLVLSGCSHCGIVNLLRYGKHLTGIERVHGVIGGFHLSGASFDKVTGPTVEALAQLQPDVLVPGHCTGRRAIETIAERMPGAFVQSCVGTRLHFGRE